MRALFRGYQSRMSCWKMSHNKHIIIKRACIVHFAVSIGMAARAGVHALLGPCTGASLCAVLHCNCWSGWRVGHLVRLKSYHVRSMSSRVSHSVYGIYEHCRSIDHIPCMCEPDVKNEPERTLHSSPSSSCVVPHSRLPPPHCATAGGNGR